MKEAYYSPTMIATEATLLLQELQQLVRLKPGLPLKRATVLLVIDAQNFFTDTSSHAYIPAASAVLPNIADLIRFFHESARPVIFTRHANSPADAGLMASWWRDLLNLESELSQITPALDFVDQRVIIKSQYDAFYRSELENWLRDLSIEDLVVTGFMTHLCCETTIRSGFVRGFRTVFPIDATATYNRHHHLATFLNLAHGFASPCLSADILRGEVDGDG
jgi:isochorismate hydrolase